LRQLPFLTQAANSNAELLGNVMAHPLRVAGSLAVGCRL
jgi:hypothetical protein